MPFGVGVRKVLRSFFQKATVFSFWNARTSLHKAHKFSSGGAEEGSGGKGSGVKSLTNGIESEVGGVVLGTDVSKHNVLHASLNQFDGKSGAVVV